MTGKETKAHTDCSQQQFFLLKHLYGTSNSEPMISSPWHSCYSCARERGRNRTTTWKTIACYLIKGETCTSYDLVILLLDTNPGEMHAHLYQDTHTRVLRAALCIVAKTWKQPKCSSAAVSTKYGISMQWNIIQPGK